MLGTIIAMLSQLRPRKGPIWEPPHPPYKIVQHEICATFHIEVRFGGWGLRGRHVSACATILRLCALLYLRASDFDFDFILG